MGSLIKTYSNEKLQGKIYTPAVVVNQMLDEINFNGIITKNTKVLDPACGDGRFLIEIVKRIVSNTDKSDLPSYLNNIYGWDIDPAAITACKENLDKIIAPYNIQINWNIQCLNPIVDFRNTSNQLFHNPKPDKFDIIVGNPPYIRIQHLDNFQRQFIRQNYSFCRSGSTDIYIAFFELCFNLLNKNGIGVLITPNTFLYTQTAAILRNYIKKYQNVRKIINFKSYQLFDNATTYSAITIFTKQQNKFLDYQEIVTEQTTTHQIRYEQLKDTTIFNFGFINQKTKSKKLKDICKIGVGITTLSDKSYIFDNLEPIDNRYCYIDTHYKGRIIIELDILKPIIKGSTFKGDEGHPRQYILFPYQQIDGKYSIIPENVLQKQYPLAYEYLLSIKHILDKRDNGKPNAVAWYAFGRQQSIDTAFGKKIIFAPMNKKPNFILSNLEQCTLYSGYYIKYDGDYNVLLQQLNSQRMHEYIMASSRDFRNGWKAYNKKIVEQFEVFDL